MIELAGGLFLIAVVTLGGLLLQTSRKLHQARLACARFEGDDRTPGGGFAGALQDLVGIDGEQFGELRIQAAAGEGPGQDAPRRRPDARKDVRSRDALLPKSPSPRRFATPSSRRSRSNEALKLAVTLLTFTASSFSLREKVRMRVAFGAWFRFGGLR